MVASTKIVWEHGLGRQIRLAPSLVIWLYTLGPFFFPRFFAKRTEINEYFQTIRASEPKGVDNCLHITNVWGIEWPRMGALALSASCEEWVPNVGMVDTQEPRGTRQRD